MAKLVLALDLPEISAALAMARQMQGILDWLKVGLELFSLAGPALIGQLRELGFQVFLDLKMYDIPNTVARAVTAATASGANMLTLHCQGGARMCQAAREAVDVTSGKAEKPILLGVTALTSFAPGEMPGVAASPADFALQLASMAPGFGLDGVVCSGQEVARVKSAQPSLLCLCPGIRPAVNDPGQAQNRPDDQRRIVTPAMAVKDGADYLVVGRPILNASSPVRAAMAINEEIAATSAA